METYDFYNLKYGVKLSLILNKDKEELTYFCFGIKDEYRHRFHYVCKNGWDIRSAFNPDLCCGARTLYLHGSDTEEDNDIVILKKNERYLKRRGHVFDSHYAFTPILKYKDIEQIYHVLIETLEQFGNDYSQAKEILNM